MTEMVVLAVAALMIIVAVSYIAPKIGVAAPILLVLVGVACSFLPGSPDFVVEPELILTIVLPPILYSAAVNVPITDFRRNMKAITGLSVVLVVASAGVIGLLLWWLLPELSLPAAIALGAVVSPPDAVAATSIGKRLGLPPRLVTVLEGEGLVNDATALVLLRSAIAATAGAVSFWGVIGDFAYAVLVAIAVGVLVGAVTVWVRSKLDDPVLTTAISFGVPFIAFVPAEELHASGVLSVVVAGLITGHQSAKFFSPQTRISERTNWRTAQLILENGVFLLMGYELHALVIDAEVEHRGVLTAVGLGVLAVVVLAVVRLGFVAVLIPSLRRDQRRASSMTDWLDTAMERIAKVEVPSGDSDGDGRRTANARRSGRLKQIEQRLRRKRADADFLVNEGLGWRGGAVLAWSGMRGVVTLAAAQTLPTDIPYRSTLVLMAFTVALVTLVLQGGTLPLLIKKLGITGSDEEADRRELIELMGELNREGLAALDNPNLRQHNGEPFSGEVIDRLRAQAERLNQMAPELLEHDEVSSARSQARALRVVMLQAERAALLDARSSGAHSSRVLQRAAAALDEEESRYDGGLAAH